VPWRALRPSAHPSPKWPSAAETWPSVSCLCVSRGVGAITILSPVCACCQVSVYGAMYKKLANVLTEFENHRTVRARADVLLTSAHTALAQANVLVFLPGPGAQQRALQEAHLLLRRQQLRHALLHRLHQGKCSSCATRATPSLCMCSPIPVCLPP
jgi:hypothetical protein